MIRLALALSLMAAAPAWAQSSNAARYLLGQELAQGCEGRGGRIDPGGLIERDLTGDGREDLIIAHDGITCAGNRGLSIDCGAQVCTVKIWVREGALLVLKEDFLGGGIEVGSGQRPPITGFAHGGGQWSVRWNGRRFTQ